MTDKVANYTIWWLSVVLSVALLATVQMLSPANVPLNSADPEGFLLLWTRYSAHLAFVFLLLAFSASTLKTLYDNGLTRSLMRYRRQLGLGFATAHAFHLTALTLFLVNLDGFAMDAGLAVAGFGYLVAAALGATSNDWSVRRLGRRRWRRLHSVGSAILMLYFFVAFSATLATKGGALYLTYVLAIVAAATAKLRTHSRRRPS